MKIDKILNGTELTIKLDGRLDTTTAPALEEELKDCLGGITKVTMDLENLEYISSAGLRVMLTLSKELYGKGKMTIINSNEIVKEVFDVTGVSSILDVQ